MKLFDVDFDVKNAASQSEAAFTRQHLHLWPEVDEAERLARLAVVRKACVDSLGYVDFEMSEDVTTGNAKENAGAGLAEDHAESGDEGQEGHAGDEPRPIVPIWGGFDRE